MGLAANSGRGGHRPGQDVWSDEMYNDQMNWGRWSLDFSGRPLIMGVVNVTPDSFSDGGDFFSTDKAVEQGVQLAAAGADILDVGGESTRPGAPPVEEADEAARVLPVIRELASAVDVPISIDTYKASVARSALAAGAAMINDISAGRFDPGMFALAARNDVP